MMKRYHRSMIRKGLLCLGAALMAVNNMAQQDTLFLSLERLLEIGGANNLTIEQYRQEQNLATADLDKAREWWLPEVYAGLQNHYLNGTAMNTDGAFFREVPRENFWAGLGFNANWDIGTGLYQSKAARLKAEGSVHRTQANKNQVMLETIHAYYDFLTAQLYNGAYTDMADQADTIVAQLQIQVESGIRFESEMLLSKSNRNYLKVKSLGARQDHREAVAELVNLLNVSPGTDIIGLDTLLVPVDLVPESRWKQSSVENIQPGEQAFENRPEYGYLQSELQSLRTEKKTMTTGLLIPEVNVGTYGAYFGGLFTPFDLTQELNVSLMWRVPIGRLTYRGGIKQYDAKIALQEDRVNQFRNVVNEEISKAISKLRMADEQFELAEESQSLARKAVEQSIQRQKLGTAKPFEVFQAQEFYLRARLDYLKAIADYNKAQYSLYVATGNDL